MVYISRVQDDAAFRLGELDPPRRFVAAADGSWHTGIPGTAGEPYYDRPAGYFNGTVDWETITEPKFGYDAAQGNNTDGLIDPVTNAVKTQLPPNSRSFILGPLVDGFVPNHIGDAFTRIGYIEKDTRQFVLLALIDGEWISGLNERFGGAAYPVWGDLTGFSQVNPNFTLDMALWFRNEMLKGRYVKNVSYNAVGGIPQQQSSNPDAPQPLGGNGVVVDQVKQGKIQMELVQELVQVRQMQELHKVILIPEKIPVKMIYGVWVQIHLLLLVEMIFHEIETKTQRTVEQEEI